ncbi:SDR family oxidoreductase [Catellatospora citrea]|uniref:Short-chain dehydrogenase n=1 Tax=Catellatospora citrea TaxID=53366 RepID=A0A8J3P3R7_9ACTN|nr:SDR family oxidoreductase [Catellatospora citrea]RKE06420.1 NAD(P)-dependent dehydrogenase (short-subunit alcohol dehydrogenase family) [Catellatospora citrea]GIG02599.1 short-chain dehydrogenase [Catellatospora citrea]
MQQNLHGKIALVAGATRGCGRAIAVELGRAGATVYVTGRSTRAQRSEMDRPETIEDTADLVTAAGGEGIAVRVDHLVPDEVRALVARVDAAHGRLDILVNDVWGGDDYAEWGKPLWEQSLDGGLRMLGLGLHTHIITSHAALPLLVRHPGGLVVEVTDGTDEYNRKYRNSFFYDLTKTSVSRIALAQSAELQPYGGTALVVTPGFLRSEAMLDHFGVTEQNWADGAAKAPHFILSETPTYLGRGVAALAADPERARWTGTSLSSAALAHEYGLTDLDGSVPDIWRYFAEHGSAENGPIDPTGYR